MISELKSVIRQYYRLESAWKSPLKNTDEYLASTCLFEYLSYRLLESDKNDILLGFRVFFRIIKRAIKSGNGLMVLDNHGNSLVVSGTIAIQQRVTEYIRRSGKVTLHSYIAKDIINFNQPGRWRLLLSLLPFALRQSFRCIFSKYRLGIALSITEVIEIAYVLHYVRKHNIKQVFDFVPYEIDSNFMYLILKENGTHVIKIPSSGPLSTHHRILLSDDVIFSTPYHFEEYQKFKDSFRVSQQLLWPPERAFQYYPRYAKETPQPLEKTLGFYSHGEWLRREEKHSAYGGRIGEAEATILGFLGRFVQENPAFKLVIFPHPREMRPELKTKMNAFYSQAITHNAYEISTYKEGTPQHFDKVDIAAAAFSTILYERLYCGYKTLIGNMAISEFPMNRSPLNKICFQSYESMSKMIHEYSKHDAGYFFEQTSLQSFLAKNYPAP